MARSKKSDQDTASDDEKIVKEAQDRFERCESWESTARDNAREDLRFVNGDSENGYQWPNDMLTSRQAKSRPCLTMNKVRQHCLLIENDAKQNKPSVNIHPSSEEASYEGAQVFEDMIRHIEYASRAEQAYDTATEFQVRTGAGYIRVITDYEDNDSFDQSIFIRRIADPFTVYLDPDAKEVDKSDGRFAFVFDDMPRDLFEARYHDHKDEVTSNPLNAGPAWLSEDHVRVAEYWRKSQKKDMLVAMVDPDSGERSFVRKSKIPKEIWDKLKDDPTTQTRPILDDRIECFTLAGSTIIDRKDWAGVYIPIVPVIGEETVIEGEMDRKGHVRYLKDPQRQYNYYTSAAVEVVALQSKTPYIGPMAAFEGLEGYWNDANIENFAWLPYNGKDDAGNPIETPQRQPPPVMPEAFVKGLEISQQEMMMVSGQYQATMGEESDEKSGKAINERQRQGDTATYHYVNNLAVAIRQVGRILVDLIPKIYDTERVVKTRAQDGSIRSVTINPNAQQAYQEQQAQNAKNDAEAQIIFNPSFGKYSVEADVGPAYATRRQEAFNAFSQIIAQNPALTNVVGDLLFQNADFPGADEIAERLRRMAPPAALGNGPPPEVQQMQAHMTAQSQIIAELSNKLKFAEMKVKAKEEQKDIDVFDAETRRITAISNAQPELGVDVIRPVVMQTLREMLGFNLKAIPAANQQDISQSADDTWQSSQGMGGQPQPMPQEGSMT